LPGLHCEEQVRSNPSNTCPVTQIIDGVSFPCAPFDCECSASVKCPPGKKVSACYCYNSNPRTKTPDSDKSYAESQKYPSRGHPANRGSFPWMLATVAGFDAIPGEVADDGTCSCTWINTMLLVSQTELLTTPLIINRLNSV
jgi:hypothetical protein